MSDIKLSYFNARGRAETSRLILAHAGKIMSLRDGVRIIDVLVSGARYIDQRLSMEQFASAKERLPYGQVPIIKVDGEVVSQSMAIAR